MKTCSNSTNAEAFETIKEKFSDIYDFNCDDNDIEEFEDAQEIREFCMVNMNILTLMIDKLKKKD